MAVTSWQQTNKLRLDNVCEPFGKSARLDRWSLRGISRNPNLIAFLETNRHWAALNPGFFFSTMPSRGIVLRIAESDGNCGWIGASWNCWRHCQRPCVYPHPASQTAEELTEAPMCYWEEGLLDLYCFITAEKVGDDRNQTSKLLLWSRDASIFCQYPIFFLLMSGG